MSTSRDMAKQIAKKEHSGSSSSDSSFEEDSSFSGELGKRSHGETFSCNDLGQNKAEDSKEMVGVLGNNGKRERR